MKDFYQLKKNLKKDFSELKVIKIALLGDSATQLLTQSLRGLGYDHDLNLEIWEAGFDQIEQQVYNLSSELYTFSFTLEDKFGDNGLICIVILKEEVKNVLFIDTWCMSCRILKRGMENFVLNTIVNFAKKNGFTLLKGEYIPTERNELVKDHYRNLGFKKKRTNIGCSMSTHMN